MSCIYNKCNGSGFYPVDVVYCDKCNAKIYDFIKFNVNDDFHYDFSIKAVCPDCGNKIDSHSSELDIEEVFKVCECKKEKDEQRSYIAKMIDGHINKKYWNKTFDTFITRMLDNNDSKDIIEFNAVMIDSLKKISGDITTLQNTYDAIWLWGSQDGSGVSTLAVILSEYFMNNNYKVRFISMKNLISSYNNYINKDAMEEFHKTINNYDLYIIDDLFHSGRYSLTDYSTIQIFNFFKDSVDNNKLLICTSNIPVSKIDNRYLQFKNFFKRNTLEIEVKGNLYGISL